MNGIKRLALTVDRYSQVLNKLFLYAATVLALYMLASISFYVIMRYFFNTNVGWIYEISRHALLYVIFLPLGYAQATGTHIKVDALTSRLSPRIQLIMGIVASSISLVAFIVFTWSGVRYASFALEADPHWTSGPVYYVPMFPVLIIIPIGFAMLSLQLVITLVKQIAALTAGKDNITKTEDIKLGGVSITDIAKN